MRAITRERYGSESVLGLRDDVELPKVGDNEVLVRVHAAGVDRAAWHIMVGLPYPIRLAGYGVRAPKAAGLGKELAGVVGFVGASVTRLQVGDSVFGEADAAFAEYAVAREDRLATMPSNVSFEQAAAVPISAVTALQALRDHGRLRPGQDVLVIGASGGVGSFAVQIASALDATVTGVCSTAKVDFVRSLGAERVIDYTQAEITDDGRRYDLVLDIAGNRPLSTLRRVLTREGTLVIVGGEGGDPWTGGLHRQLGAVLLSRLVRHRLVMFVSKTTVADLDALRAMIEARAVTPAIDQVMTLDQVPEAMRDLAAGQVRGKRVIAIP